MNTSPSTRRKTNAATCRFSWVLAAVSLLATRIPAQVAPIEIELPTIIMEPFRVETRRIQSSDLEGPDASAVYDATQIDDSGAFTLNEFLETLPPSDGEEVLVLIDGEPAYIDPSTLPLGMIAGVDVNDEGSMPAFGAYSGGRVINIRLKKDYQGGEAGLNFTGSFLGGGGQRAIKLSTTAVRGKFRALVALNYSKRLGLAATDREFSRTQDHTSWGGSDLRLPWGLPSVVQAVSGSLHGLVDADGNPVATALVPEFQDGLALTPLDFLAGGSEASGLRRFDTAAYRMLTSPSEQLGSAFTLTYSYNPRLRLTLSGSYTQSQTERIGSPPVTPVSEDTLVPAAYNPFSQDVQVGLVHSEFGPTRQGTQTDRAQIGLKLNGRLNEKWSWTGGVLYSRDDSAQTATDLDTEKLAESLRAGEPAKRFNPFGDPAAGPVNAHLYPALTVVRTNETIRDNLRLDFSTNAQVAEIWGGPVNLSAQGGFRQQERFQLTTGARDDDLGERHFESTSHSASGSVNLPLVGRSNALPGLNRLEARFSSRYTSQDDGSEGSGEEIGLVWAPFRSLMLRARHSGHLRVFSRDVADLRDTLVDEELLDPRRGFAMTPAEVFSRDLADPRPEKSERQSLGLTYQPPWVKGLRFSTNYQVSRRFDLFQRRFDAQDVVNNEAVFPGRVIRAEPTAGDLALGRPGAIQSVDTTSGNAGDTRDSRVDFSVDYSLPWQQFGRIRVSGSARHALESRYEVRPGFDYIYDGDRRSERADLDFRGTVSWGLRTWSASARFNYSGGVPAAFDGGDGLSSRTHVDVNVGWRFRLTTAGKEARYRLGVGIGNVFDEQPVRADTLSGYRGGSPLGRTYTCSLTAAL